MKIEFEHNMAAHCENGVTSNLLNFYGTKLSEPMVFGLGSGMFFSYLPFLKINGCPLVTFRPMPGVVFKGVMKTLGAKVYVKKYRKNQQDKALQDLDENLKQGIPTGMVVGVFNLIYLPDIYRFHFNAHNIVCIGKEGDEYLISDPVMPTVERLTAKQLLKVRFAQGLGKPRGKMYYVKNIKKTPDLKKAVKKALKRTVFLNYTMKGPIVGAWGIEFLSKRIRKWPKRFGDKIAARYVGNIVRMQEEIGTGGAGFRFLFAAFLQEAAKILNIKELHDLSLRMTEVGDMWREFAVAAGRICKGRQDKEDYNTLGEQLHKISLAEKQVYKELQEII